MTNMCGTHTSPAGTQLSIRGLLLRNAVLPSAHLVDSGLAAPAPLAFNLSSGNTTTLVLDSCTVISSSCSNLAQFARWLDGLTPTQADVQVLQVCVKYQGLRLLGSFFRPSYRVLAGYMRFTF